MELVNQHGSENWNQIAVKMSGRNVNQCKQRWFNHLNHTINNDTWTNEEDISIIEQQKKLGNRWTKLPNLFQSVHMKMVKIVGIY